MAIEKKISEVELLEQVSSNTNVVCEQDGSWKRLNIFNTDFYKHSLNNNGIEVKGDGETPVLVKIITNALGHVIGCENVTKDDIINLGIPAQDTTYGVGGEQLGLVKNGGNVAINPDGTMTAPEFFNPEASYGETDRYYYDGTERQFVLSDYGVTLPVEGITSAWKLNLEITKEQVDAMERVVQLDMNSLSYLEIDLEDAIISQSDNGNIYTLGDLGFFVVAYADMVQLTVESMGLTIPVPEKGAYIIVPDTHNPINYPDAYVLLFEGGTITAQRYSQIDNKYLRTPILDIPDKIGYAENGGIRMRNASETTEHGFAVGDNAKATKRGAVAIGGDCVADGIDSLSTGLGSKTRADYAIAMGHFCTSNYPCSYSIGNGLIANAWCQSVFGSFNQEDAAHQYINIIGGGGSNDIRRNLYTLNYDGQGYFANGASMTGADYAEYFEWEDGNKDNEDRVGLLVTLDGDKIKFANSGDEILGIISGTAAVLGDNYECDWNGKYLTDDFGRIQCEDVEKFYEVFVGIDEETKEPIIETKSLGFFKQPIINPDYNPDKEYVNRANRPEWSAVGMLGKLYVRDNGTCEVNGYATVGEDGVATKSDEKTNMRVLSRVNENVIRVLLK